MKGSRAFLPSVPCPQDAPRRWVGTIHTVFCEILHPLVLQRPHGPHTLCLFPPPLPRGDVERIVGAHFVLTKWRSKQYRTQRGEAEDLLPTPGRPWHP